MVATRARRASGEGTPKQTATKRVAARSKSPAPKKPAARCGGARPAVKVARAGFIEEVADARAL